MRSDLKILQSFFNLKVLKRPLSFLCLHFTVFRYMIIYLSYNAPTLEYAPGPSVYAFYHH